MTTANWAWSERLNTRYEPMDETHKEFVSLCAALLENHPPSFLARLDALIAHTVIHFDQENTWMHDHDFPPAGCHHREHDAVLQLMREVRASVDAGDVELGPRLAEELPFWFEHHVDGMDNMLARFMTGVSADVAIANATATGTSQSCVPRSS